MTRVLYIGNKLEHQNRTLTTISTLGKQLEENHTLSYASSFKNKLLRLLHMWWMVLLKARNTDVVLIDTYSTSNFYYAWSVGFLCKILKLPYIPILHGGNLASRLDTSKKLSKMLFENAMINVAPSSFLMEAFQDRGYKKLIHIPNTIEITQYPFKERLKFTPKLLWVRSFAKIYNPEMAVSVASQLRDKGYEVELCMVGPEKDGSMAATRSLAEQHQLNVTFTGKLTKEAWIALSKEYDIFINTTNFDNMPVSVIEAMALGMPVVSTNVGGIPFLLKNEEEALLVPAENTEAMVGEIERLLQLPSDYQRMVQNARQKAEKFDWSQVKEQWTKLLENA